MTTTPQRTESRRKRFEQELEPHLSSLYRAATRLTRDPTRGEDLLQEAVLKAFRFFDGYKPGTNFRAWIFRVLYTVFINKTRDRAPKAAPLSELAEPAQREDEMVESLDRKSHGARVGAVLEAVDDRIKQAVDELPFELRTVFLLSTVEELKYREIAEVMETPLGTVMSRLFRARRMLQDKLYEYAQEVGYSTEDEAEDASKAQT
jgi:RNA polymerase sigma-70 factor (ECF subfamily)